MRLASGPVLGLAAVVSSPALLQGLDGTLAIDVVLTRYLVAVGLAWVALSALAMLVGTTPRATVPGPGEATSAVPADADEPDPLV